MKNILDPVSFERVWRELDSREKAQPDSDRWPETVWLECNGEVVSIAALDTTSARDPALGLDLVQFDCPRCGRRHESLHFR
jgi:hypothetical protein